MKRKVFINKRNGQMTVTLPRKKFMKEGKEFPKVVEVKLIKWK